MVNTLLQWLLAHMSSASGGSAPGPHWGTSVPSPPALSPSETNFRLCPCNCATLTMIAKQTVFAWLSVNSYDFEPTIHALLPPSESTQLFCWKNWITLARRRRMNEAGNIASLESAYLKYLCGCSMTSSKADSRRLSCTQKQTLLNTGKAARHRRDFVRYCVSKKF